MRRYRTRTTAWPAVADLMTALAVVGLACAVMVASRERDAQAEVIALQAQVDSLEKVIDTLRVVIDDPGPTTTPCWPRTDSIAPHYWTYDVTVQAGLFSILPHEDWGPGTDFRGTLSQSIVELLEDYPRGDVAGEQVVSFGRRVHRAVRDAAPSANDADDCNLMVTVNRGANGHDVGVLTSAGFYPIYR